ncbi:MAG: response regulator [Gaiellales bacterium]
MGDTVVSREDGNRTLLEPGFVRRALVVEDDVFTRSLVEHLLEGASFTVLACASSAEAIDAFAGFDPDVLVVDIQLGAAPNGAQLAEALRQRAPYLGVVVISNFPLAETAGMGQPLPAGAAYLHKGQIEEPRLLLEAIDSVLIDSMPRIVRSAPKEGSPLARLSPAQLAILHQIALGLSNAEIARQRGTSLRNVEKLVSRMFGALGVSEDPAHNPRVAATRIYIDAMGVPRDEA